VRIPRVTYEPAFGGLEFIDRASINAAEMLLPIAGVQRDADGSIGNLHAKGLLRADYQ
jgi:hypothetical protein